MKASVIRSSLCALLAATLARAPALAHRQHSFGNVFDGVSLGDAFALAKKEFTLVFVYVTRPGGKASPYLERPTWHDWQKIDLLIRESVLVKVDAKWAAEQLRRYELETLPAVLLLNTDGTERFRLVGDLPLDELMRKVVADLSGEDSVARVRAAVEKSGGQDPLLRERLAETLARHGALAEALQEYLWCLDVGLQQHERFAAARRARLLKHFVTLADQYPPARAALQDRQSAMEKRLLGEPDDVNLAGNIAELNNRRDENRRTLALFDDLAAGSKARRILFSHVLDELVKARRYGEVISQPDANRAYRYDRDLAIRDPKRAFMREVSLSRMRRGSKDEGPEACRERGTRAFTIARGAALVEALAGLGRLEEARALVDRILRFDESLQTVAVLADRAQRAGSAELVHYIQSKQPVLETAGKP
jgi:hypothetical protein